jgi:hypothetical protein
MSSSKHGGKRNNSGRKSNHENASALRRQEPNAGSEFVKKFCMYLHPSLIPLDGTADSGRIDYIGDPLLPFESVRYIDVTHSTSRQGDRMEDCGLQRTDWIPQSGDCQLQCTSFFLYGDLDPHIEVRSQVIDHIRHHPELYKTVILNESKLNVDQYCKKMEQGGEFGGDVFIAVIAIIFGISIRVIILEDTAGEADEDSRIATMSLYSCNIEKPRATLQVTLQNLHYEIAFSSDSDEIWGGI